MSDFTLGRDRLGDPRLAGRAEWLVTNGVGGFAAGTVSGLLARRDHGLLFAALKPPLGRTLLLAKLAESVELDGRWFDLDSNLWSSGILHPTGHLHLESFEVEDSIPTWTWAIGDMRLEKRIWMEQGENTTYVQYRLATSHGPVTLSLKALANHRDSRDTVGPGDWAGRVEPATGGLRIEVFEGATPLWLLAPGAQIRAEQTWYRGFALEHEREADTAVEDHLCAGEIVVRLSAGEYFTLVASTRRDAGTGEAAPLALASALARRRSHERSLVDTWRQAHPGPARSTGAWLRQLVVAADAFVVDRPTPVDPAGRSILSSYPWNSDCTRDAMVALPGLTLATGRPEVARAVLSTIARHIDRGLLPEAFPDPGEESAACSADTSLWYFNAVRAYFDATGDQALLAEVFPVLEDIIAWYERGTHGGITVDPDDGLLRAGEGDAPATWMDAIADGVAATPRHGKAVEVNALWFNALTVMAMFAKRLKRASEAYVTKATRLEKGFRRFWNPVSGCLFDVLDGPQGSDPAIRPNQILAVSLADSPLSPGQRRAVVDVCGRSLLTSYGLRTLSAGHPDYRGTGAGSTAERARALHQGTAWVWLLGHFAIAHERVHGRRDVSLGFLEPLRHLVRDGSLGFLPESVDGDAPHATQGSRPHAPAVGETLRAYHALAAERRRIVRRTAKPVEALARA